MASFFLSATNTTDFTDFLISFSIVMLLLSFISERFSNFIKLYFNNKTIFIPFLYFYKKKLHYWFKAKIKILSTKQPTKEAEKEREYRIMTINILVGVFVATAINANFFEIIDAINSMGKNTDTLILKSWDLARISKNIYPYLSGLIFHALLIWSISLILFKRLDESTPKLNPKWRFSIPLYLLLIFSIYAFNCINNFNYIIQHSIGFIITGVFLSLGSKFWHDLLDVLFKYRNIRQTLNTKSTYTDFDSPEAIMALANTSHYEVADKLMDVCKEKFKDKKGIVSYGLITSKDVLGGYYKRVIEVEYTTPQAHQDIEKLCTSVSVSVNHNTFYLKDYIKLTLVNDLIALEDSHSLSSSNITTKPPICYAFNTQNKSNKIYGSFSLLKKKNGSDYDYYAEGSAHVFLSQEDLKTINANNKTDNSNYNINHKTVTFKVGDYEEHKDIKIWSFSNTKTFKDYAKCKVSKELFEKFEKLINPSQYFDKMDVDSDMLLLSATSKEKYFRPSVDLDKTTTTVHYKAHGFTKELDLLKIKGNHKQALGGDSGGKLYYVRKENDKLVIKTAIVVASSDKNTYVFKTFRDIHTKPINTSELS